MGWEFSSITLHVKMLIREGAVLFHVVYLSHTPKNVFLMRQSIDLTENRPLDDVSQTQLCGLAFNEKSRIACLN